MKEYCWECQRLVEVDISEEPVEVYVTPYDKMYIIGQVARCLGGHEVYISDIENKNRRKAQVAYDKLKPLMD